MTRDQSLSITLLPKDGPQQDPRILASKIATTNADIADDRAWFTAKGGETMELVSEQHKGNTFLAWRFTLDPELVAFIEQSSGYQSAPPSVA